MSMKVLALDSLTKVATLAEFGRFTLHDSIPTDPYGTSDAI